MEKFYIINISTLPDPKYEPDSLVGLSQERQEKCLRYSEADDRKRSLGAGRLINQILNEHDCAGSLRYVEAGKPEAEGIYFSVSHSGDYVIAVSSDTPVGCDIEKMGRAPLKVAERFFAKEERDYIMSHTDRDFAFWQLWTLKESYIKMTGDGLRVPLGSFKLNTNEKLTLYREGIEQNVELKHFIHDGYSIAVCKQKGM